MTTESLGRLVGFGRYLRDLGLPVGTGRILTFCRAVAAFEPAGKTDLYWAARSSLISCKEHIEEFDRAFYPYFGEGISEEMPSHVDRSGPEMAPGADEEPGSETGARSASWTLSGKGDNEEAFGQTAAGVVASSTEVLHTKSFGELSGSEEADAAALIRRLEVSIPLRRSRRLRPASRGGQFDLRRTLRYSLRTQGEPFHRARRGPRPKMRPLVLILDVSGSMSPYSRALLQFGFAAMAASHRVEVFCFGTRLTRVTRFLKSRDPNRALKGIAEVVRDWEGGTRIGESLHELLSRYARFGFLRGAVVVLCSDGLERGDPDLLAASMERLGRLAWRLVWVNPLKGSPVYQPLARGMAAALPHVDLFWSGHNVASLESLGEILAR